MKSVKNRSIKGSHAKRQAFLLLKETHPGLKQAAFQKFCRRVLGCGFRLGPSLPHRKPGLALSLGEKNVKVSTSLAVSCIDCPLNDDNCPGFDTCPRLKEGQGEFTSEFRRVPVPPAPVSPLKATGWRCPACDGEFANKHDLNDHIISMALVDRNIDYEDEVICLMGDHEGLRGRIIDTGVKNGVAGAKILKADGRWEWADIEDMTHLTSAPCRARL